MCEWVIHVAIFLKRVQSDFIDLSKITVPLEFEQSYDWSKAGEAT